MGENNLQLGDLISLEGLEKPMGGLRWELGGDGIKPERVDQLEEGMSDFAGTIEDHKDVGVGEVTVLVEALKKAMIRGLSPERAAGLMVILKERFEAKDKHYKTAEGIKWEDVEKKLRASPEKLWSLQQLEDTCGEPEVFAYDEKTAEYIFYDCSLESPEGRRNCVYDREGEEILKRNYPGEKCDGNAVSMAALMGVDLLDEKEYKELQTKGEFDKNSWSWIKTPIDERKRGIALVGDRLGADVRVYESLPRHHVAHRGWRASLRV